MLQQMFEVTSSFHAAMRTFVPLIIDQQRRRSLSLKPAKARRRLYNATRVKCPST